MTGESLFWKYRYPLIALWVLILILHIIRASQVNL